MLAVNLSALVVMAWDKWRARRGEWRVPETTLILLGLIGGGLGLVGAMFSLHHKTRKFPFKIGAAIALVSTVTILLFVVQLVVG